jgi:UrcA family protein
MNKFITNLSTAGCGIALAAASFAALADNDSASRNSESRSITVSYSDLNLSHPHGIEELYSRLNTAASRVCGPKADPRNIRKSRNHRQCVASAIDNAVAEIDSPKLQRHHLVETGHQVIEDNRTLASSE